jgi:hypothetical protein
VALGGCESAGTNLFGSSDNFFNSLAKTSGNISADAGNDANAASTNIECPEVSVRNGAATLLIGSKPGEAEPAALDVRYQGSIIRTARECHVNAGIVTMKVGIEGRIITGPAGGPGTVDVPMRIAVVHEGVNPKTVLSKFAREQVTVNNAVDRVTFTHIDPEISFPLPQPAANIDAYIVYVGFDPLGAPQPKVKKKPVRQRAKPSSKPKPAAQPRQS